MGLSRGIIFSIVSMNAAHFPPSGNDIWSCCVLDKAFDALSLEPEFNNELNDERNATPLSQHKALKLVLK